ncbi:hypothetical protein BDV59DRAFT_199726 [Aspergillus ambiguus]|uniref:uncharacterized protein n=1 Tax=Aspergillus ambiguus TaxID=176160 RepID=UPI003CCDD15B
MQPDVVENGHEANGNGIVVQKRPTLASSSSTVTRTRSSMSTMASSFSTIRSLTSVEFGDRVFKYGLPLDISDGEVDSFDTVEEALDAIAAERLRHMPHDGSMLDRIFKWATYVIGHINELSKAVEPFVPNASEMARISWGNCLMLVQAGPDQSSVLMKPFRVFQDLVLELARFINQSALITSIPGIQSEIAGAYIDLVELISAVTMHYCRNSRGPLSIDVTEFDLRFGHHIQSFYTRKKRFTELIWSTTCILQNANIKDIKSFLSFQDSAIPAVLSSRRPLYAEFTCDWFMSHLSQIRGRDNGLSVITGAPGSGKTVLSQWIIDQLQTSIDDEVDVISYRIYEDIMPTVSSIALVKGLLLQILDRQVGNERLLQALDKAIHFSSSNASIIEAEEALWDALRIGVQGVSRLMVVVDGIGSALDDPDMGSRILQRLSILTAQNTHVKAIVLSRPLKKPLPQRTFQFSLEPTHIRSDVRTVILQDMSATRPFSGLKPSERDAIADTIISRSDSTFLWPRLVMDLASQQRTVSDILSAVETAPISLGEVMELIVSKLNLDDSTARSSLAWLLAAQRPLFVHEIRALLEIDAKKLEHVHRVGPVHEDILHSLGPLVTILEDIVCFKHTVFRYYLLGMAGSVVDFSNTGKFPFHIKEAHYDLVIRSLAHVRCLVRDEVEVSVAPLGLSTMAHFFRKYDLLEYTARYWTHHFLESPMAEGNDYKLSPTFKQCLSESVLLALLEGSCLRMQYTQQQAERLQAAAFRVRKMIFVDSSASVIQALIFESLLSHSLRLNESVEYAYEAWMLSKKVLGYNNLVAKACAELFVQVLEIPTEISEKVVSYKEEILLYLVEMTKEDRGSSHEITIKYFLMLVQLYIDIKQTEKATHICKELYDISVSRYGQFSAKTAEIGTLLFEQLHYLSQSETAKEIIETSHEYTIRTLEITDQRRIDYTLSVVEVYEKRGDITKAEAAFFELWQGLSRIQSTSEEIVLKQISVAMAYSEFLVRHSSRDEAENIIAALWTSIERRQEFRLDQVVTWSQRISAHMTKMQWYSLAQTTLTTVLKRCQTSEESSYAESISESLIETIHETTEETTETETETTTVVAKRKKVAIAREAFESVMSSKKTSKEISVATIKTAETLVSSYVEEKQWNETIRVSQRLLERAWKGIETGKTVVTLTKGVKETVTVALNLATSYFETLQIEKATLIYYNVFHSLLLSISIDDELVTHALRAAVEFYEKTYQFSHAITLYQDYITAIQSVRGQDDHLVVEINYTLADLAIRCHQSEEAEGAFYHIYTVFNRDGNLHPDGIEAAHGLCKLYMEQQKWEAALDVYAVLWDAITKHAKELQLDAEYVQEVYQSYIYLLETKLHVEATIIRDLAYNYREICISLYGHQHIMTYRATVQLAEVSRTIEQYHEESIEMYESALRYSEEYSEEVLTYESTTTREKTTKKKTAIKEHLAEMYSKSEKTISRASDLYMEEFTSTRAQYGYASQETLTSLEQLVFSYKKQSTITEAVNIMQSVVTTVFETETDTQRLTESARRLAQMYLAIEQQDMAVALFQDLRRRLVYESNTISRKATVFVVAFEEVISGGSYTAIMADLVAEMHLYDAFFTVAKTATFIQAFITGVRLLIFQQNKNQVEESRKTDAELFKLFISNYVVSDEADIRSFYELCIAEVLHSDYEISISSRIVLSVHKHLEEESYQSAYNLASLLHQFIGHVDGFRHQAIVKQGFKLCKYLQGHGVKTSPDLKVQAAMLVLSKSILTDILQVYRSLGVRFTELDVSEVNELAILLGEQRNFDDLERLLTDLWTSRTVQKTWSSDTIVAIGRRLVEAQFSCGKQEKTEHAIRLCSDIHYNLRRVWGTFDRSALELTTLLSELYTATGHYGRAMAVHEELLRQVVSESGKESSSLSLAEGATIACRHVELLKRSAQRLGGWDKEEHLYKQLLTALNERFEGEQAWRSVPLEQLDEWVQSEADELGLWRAPASYGFLLGGGKEQEKKPAHRNQLRKVSETRLLTVKGFA